MINLNQIRESLRATGFNVEKTACNLQLSTGEVREVLYGHGRAPAEAGRPELAPYLVTSKRTRGPWQDWKKIKEARISYNLGTHELVQCTQNGWTWLYSVPRKEPVPPRRYFDTRTF